MSRIAADPPQQTGAPCAFTACGSTRCRWRASQQLQQHRKLHRSPGNACSPACIRAHINAAALSKNRSSIGGADSGRGNGCTSSGSSSSRPHLRSSPTEVLALDVEYAHLALPKQTRLGRSRVSIVPAEVCLAAPGGAIAFNSFCHPGDGASGAKHVGGVPEAAWGDAPQLAEVCAQVRALIEGRRVVGHGLGKDLAALGIEHPRELQVDTVGCAAFQGPSGQARPLAALTQQLLGRSIQTDATHSAREDALATLELYLRFVAEDTARMDADDLRQHELEQILAHAHQAASRQADHVL